MALLREAAESYLEVAKQRWKAMQPWRAQFFLDPPPKNPFPYTSSFKG
jgi:hypothetical protein